MRLTRFAALATFLALVAGAAGATSIVMVSDENLVRQAEVIAVARITAAGPAADRDFVTEYSAAVQTALKGSPGGELRFRVTGGRGPGGLGLAIYGAPTFVVGERVLLFLGRRSDGTFRILHLALGAFHEAADAEGRVAVRDLSEIDARDLAGEVAAESVRDMDRFVDWIRRQAAGLGAAADYFREARPATGSRIEPQFTFARYTDGNPVRWFAFDNGGFVDWKALAVGQSGLAGGGYAEIQSAIAAWKNNPGTRVNYRYLGTTATDKGFKGVDNQNGVLFNDPHDEVEDFSCDTGGVVARGGPFFELAVTAFKGHPYHRIVESNMVVNNGLECLFAASVNASKLFAETAAHEFGHTLGLAHSCDAAGPAPACVPGTAEDEALMRWLLHDDGRGAVLGSDDKAGLLVLYPAPPAVFVAAPTNLTATASAGRKITLKWLDKSNNEDSFRIEMRVGTAAFKEVASTLANRTILVVTVPLAGTRYEFRVRARKGTAYSLYSNRASAVSLH